MGIRHRLKKVIALKQLVLVIVTAVLIGTMGCSSYVAPPITTTSVTTATIEDIVAKVSPAVVRIVAQAAMGSGMIVDSDGYILTASHVVEGVATVTVGLNSREQVSGTVIGRDDATDLAIVRIDRKALPTVTLGDSSKLKPGQEVVAVGYPLDLAGSVTVTKGIISAMRESDLIQTDVAVNPGNSGGPLVNLLGEVVGVNIAGIRVSKGMPIQGMNFALATNAARNIIPRLKVPPQVPTAIATVTTPVTTTTTVTRPVTTTATSTIVATSTTTRTVTSTVTATTTQRVTTTVIPTPPPTPTIAPIPGTIFAFSGTRSMTTPPFKISSSPWRLRYMSNVAGGIGILVMPDGKPVVSQSVEAGTVYETYVYNQTGSLYFNVSSNDNWTLQVVQ